jgi:hypothetical protein
LENSEINVLAIATLLFADKKKQSPVENQEIQVQTKNNWRKRKSLA